MSADIKAAMEWAKLRINPNTNDDDDNLAAAFLEVTAELAALRELHNIYNLGGMTDYNDGPMKRALAAEQRCAQIERENEVLRIERQQDRARVERSVQILSHIYALMHSEDIVSDGKRFHFHPPEPLVREAWEGLSAAIRNIPDELSALAPTNAAEQEK